MFTLLGLFIAVPAYQLLSVALWPRLAEQVERRFMETPGRALTAGLGLALPLLVPPAVFFNVQAPPSGFVGACWMGGLLGMALTGLHGLAVRVGHTMPGPHDSARPWLRGLKGIFVLQLACLVPLLGWFLVFPILLVAGIGATALAWLWPLREAKS